MKVWVKTLGFIALWRSVLLGLTALAARIIPFNSDFTPATSFGLRLPYMFWVWGNFDGMVFMLIARSSYTAEQVAFFPLLPILIKLGTLLGLRYVLSGLLISLLAFFLAQYFIYKLLQLDGHKKLYWLLLAVMLLFPTAPYYTAIYADALFLALATATLYYSRRKNWFMASMYGGLATLARLNGLALIAIIGAEYLLSLEPKLVKSWNWRLIWPTLKKALNPSRLLHSGVLWSLIIPAAFIGFLFYIDNTFGDWHKFFTGVEVWHRDKLTFPLQTFWRYFKIIVLYPRFTFTYVVALLEAAFTGLYILALIWSWGKIRLSYWLMIFFHLLIPVMTGTLQGMPRYGLHLYPLFMIYTLFLQNKPKWVKAIWFGVSAMLLVFYTMYYTRGYFVA